MADLYAEHSRYQLINFEPVIVQPRAPQRRKCKIDAKALVVITVVTLPVICFCVIYMSLFGIYKKVIFPNTFTMEEIPEFMLSRALKYNNIIYNESKMSNYTKQNFDFGFTKTTQDVLPHKIVCYYNFPQDELYRLEADDIDPYLCTHINVGFANIVNNTLDLTESNIKSLKKVVKLKKENDNLKILLSVGGAGEVNGFPEMVLNHTNRKQFIKSVVSFMKAYSLDGIDLDWEFPSEHTKNDKYQRMHFTQFLRELRKSIDRLPQHKRFLLTVAVAAPIVIIEESYDVAYMNQYVDFINLMSYDYHFYTKVTPFTGFNSPLYAGANDKYYLSTLNINYSANYWNYLGMERKKIVIGLPTYGHSFRLTNTKNNGILAPAKGYGKLGVNGFVDFSQVCTFLTVNQISPVFDMETKSPYATKYGEWVSFDDENSLTFKAEYIRDNQYAGAMVYSLNADDHKGICSVSGRSEATVFPLTKKIKEILSSDRY